MTVITRLSGSLSASDKRLAQYDSDVSSPSGTQSDYNMGDMPPLGQGQVRSVRS